MSLTICRSKVKFDQTCQHLLGDDVVVVVRGFFEIESFRRRLFHSRNKLTQVCVFTAFASKRRIYWQICRNISSVFIFGMMGQFAPENELSQMRRSLSRTALTIGRTVVQVVKQ